MRVLPDKKGTKRLLLILATLVLATMLCAFYFTSMPGSSHSGPMTPLSQSEQALASSIKRHVEQLATVIGQRSLITPNKLKESAAYISRELREAGYEVQLLPYQVGNHVVNNIEATLKGSACPDRNVVVGAHYDTVPGTKGANDNASAVAAVIELARTMKHNPTKCSIRFVLFVNEEPPYFKTDAMGSHVYASALREQGVDVISMLSIETIGYYTDRPGSQRYPFPMNLLYPDTGNFIAFVGNIKSRGLVRKSIKAFRDTVEFPSEGAAVPGFLPGVDWSDHWGFWQNGYPGIMVTDTAVYRYSHYHTFDDTPDKLDYNRIARVVTGLESVIRRLASD